MLQGNGMNLSPNPTEMMARARSDLRSGLPVGLMDEGRLALVAAAETLTPARCADLRALGSTLVLAITARRAETLKARVYDGDLARLIVPADEGCRWIHAVANPVDDLRVPFKGPFQCERGGSPAAHRAAIALAKSARLMPAALVAGGLDPADLPDGITCLDAAAVLAGADRLADYDRVVAARVPLELAEAGKLHVYRPDDGGEEHYAIEIGDPPRSAPVLARLHSACFTGDILGSLKCDCGPQLRGALAMMGEANAGVLLYLNQEGRGIGLANKMRAYALQDQGFDTVDANHRLGFEDDERDFRIGAALLRNLGFGSTRLITNNPAKVDMMRSSGIEVVERVPMRVGHSHHNAGYLSTKKGRSGHLL